MITQFGEGAEKYVFPATIQHYSANFGDLVTQTMRLPGVDGGFDQYGDETAPAAVGQVTLGFTLVTESRAAMTAARDAVRQMAQWGKKRLFWQPTDPALPLRWTWARINYLGMGERPAEHSDLWQPVTINWQCADPAWYGRGSEGKLWGELKWWGLLLPGGDCWGGEAAWQAVSGQSTLLATATNAGNANSLPRISLVCGAGQSATNPVIERVAAGVVRDRAQYTGTLSAGDELAIDCRSARVTLNGAGVYAALSVTHPDWLRLAPGANTLRLRMAYTTDACSVRVRWYDVWR